jgi:large subunit ribosomal protein L24
VPLAALKAFIEPLASSYRPSFPVRLGIGVDAVTLASGTLQNVRGDIKLDDAGWDIETFEFRGPGFAQVRLSGRIAADAHGVSFKGPAQIEATDPRSFLAWLEGRADAVARQPGVLRASGDLNIGTQQFAVDRLKFEFDRKTIEGRIAYAADGARPRLDADLKAGELDVDGVLAFARAALEGSAFARPRDVALSVDVGRAAFAGVDIKGVSGTFKLDPAGITFDHVHIADLAGAAFNLNGRMEGALDAPRGTVTFDVDARGLDGTVAVLSRYWPDAAGVVRHAASRIVPLKTHATLGIEPVSSTDPGGNSKIKLALDGTGGALRMKFDVEGAGDVGSLTLPEFRLDGNLATNDGTVLTALLGVDSALNVDKRPGALSLAVRKHAGSDAQVTARATAGGFVSTAKGTARLFSEKGFSSALDVTLSAADVSPVRRGAAARSSALLPLAVRAKLDANSDQLAFDQISGIVGNSQVRGKLKLALGSNRQIDAQIDAESADVAALVAIFAGMPKHTASREGANWLSDPFGESLLAGFGGRIAFSTGRASLAPTLVARDARATVQFGDGELAIDDAEGTLAGGRASGRLVMRRGAEGVALHVELALANAEASALLPTDTKAPVSGRLTLRAQAEGSGLSPASVVGSLNGAGTVTLEDAQFANLDPKAFAAAIRAVDQGLAVDAARVRDIVTTVLDGGRLAVPRLDAPITISAGQAILGQTTVLGQGADLAISGSADVAGASIDARLTLSGPAISEGTNSIRPEVLISLKGPYAAPKRSIDVSALSGWLMLRSVERQSKQISAIEAERRDFERREGERREAERREAEKQEAERREAEKREAERKATEPKASTSSTPAALPVPQIMEEPSAPPPRLTRPQRPRQPAAEQAPTLPPPLNIGPPPGSSKPAQPSRSGNAAAQNPPPPPPRSALDILFGVQR